MNILKLLRKNIFFFILLIIFNLTLVNYCFFSFFINNDNNVFTYIFTDLFNLKKIFFIKLYFTNYIENIIFNLNIFFLYKSIYFNMYNFRREVFYNDFLEWLLKKKNTIISGDITMDNIIKQLNNSYNLMVIILIFIFLLSLTIWTRASGPRTRVDQLHYLTWKEILISLFIVLLLVIITNITM